VLEEGAVGAVFTLALNPLVLAEAAASAVFTNALASLVRTGHEPCWSS